MKRKLAKKAAVGVALVGLFGWLHPDVAICLTS